MNRKSLNANACLPSTSGRRGGVEGAALPHKSKTPAIVHQPAAQLYERFVAGIKERIRTVQIKAALAANAELVPPTVDTVCKDASNAPKAPVPKFEALI